MTLCWAAVFDGAAGQIALRQVPIQRLRSNEVLVRVLGCTLCGSDLHSFEGRRTVSVPTILGHEIVGEIVDFGTSCPQFDMAGKRLECGDRIVWAIVANCGHCEMCLRDLPQKCLRGVKYGHESFRPERELLGGLAEFCLLVEGTSIVRLPDDLPMAVACPASCATATVAAALEAAGPLRGMRVCLLGAGMLGLTACAMVKSFGAAEVVCVDPIETRRATALLFGATVSIRPDELGIAGGQAGFDVAIELSGSTSAFNAIWPQVRIGGTLVLVGSVFPNPPVPIELEQIVRRQLTIRGVHNYSPRHLLAAVEFLQRVHRQFPFETLVSEWWPLSSVSGAFRQSGLPSAIRVGVRPDGI